LNFSPTSGHALSKIPISSPGEVEAAIRLSSNKSSFVTGHSLLGDGGFTAQ